MKSSTILVLIVFAIGPSAQAGDAHRKDWRQIGRLFVNTRRTRRIFRQFHSAMNDETYPLVLLTGMNDSDKIDLLEHWLDHFRRHFVFSGGPLPLMKSSEPEMPLDEVELKNAVREELEGFRINRQNGRGTVVLLTTAPMEPTDAPRLHSFLTYLGVVYRDSVLFNKVHPNTPVRFILESTWNGETLLNDLGARRIRAREVDFSSACDFWLTHSSNY